MHRTGMNRQRLTAAVTIALASFVSLASAQSRQTAPEPLTLDVIEVKGVRDALLNARAKEREEDAITSIVTGDDIGQFADENPAEALQRVPGVSIDRDAGEGRRITVRGLGAQFNPVTYSGALLATSDTDRDAVIDVLPNDLLGSLVVYKTITPDLDGAAVGALVDLQPVDPIDAGNSRRVTLGAGQQDYNGDVTPNVNAAFSQRFERPSGRVVGLSVAASYQDRSLSGDIVRNRNAPRYSRVGGECGSTSTGPECFLRSNRVENRHTESARERAGLAFGLNVLGTEESEFYVRGIFSRLDRDDTIWNDRWNMGNNRAIAIGPRTGSYQGGNDVELRKQLTFNERNEETSLLQFGGSKRFDSWLLDGFLAGSRNTLDVPTELTGRFRVRNIRIDVDQSDESINVRGLRRDAQRPDPADPANYNFDEVSLVTQDRTDEILQVVFNAQRDMEWGNGDGFLKFGAKIHRRDKDANRDQIIGNPVGLGGAPATNLSQLPLVQLNTRIPNWGFQPEANAARSLFLLGLPRLNPNATNSAAEDFSVGEDIDAVYGMFSFSPSAQLSFFGGLRVERTTWDTDGFALETVDPFADGAATTLNIQPISAARKTYTDAMPSLHLRFDASEALVLRASLSRAILRPNFDEGAATTQILSRELEDGTYFRSYSGGNPNLDALTASQFDVSLAWYPADETVLYAGFFYKDISDFFIRSLLLGDDVAQIGFTPGDGSLTGGFDSVEAFINGSDASVRGIELAFDHSFSSAPGLLSGLFVSGNYTWVDSRADYGAIGRGGDLPLPDQADRIANLTLGWENERVSFRVSGNYRSDSLDTVGSQPEFDQILLSWFSTDFSVRYSFTDDLQLFADIININEKRDSTVYRGDGAGAFPADEGGIIDFGRSYRLGLRYLF